MRKWFTVIVSGMVGMGAYAHSIDFDKIENWTGEGNNRAALVIQFGGEYEPSDAYVWGYRWKDGETPSGEDMVRAICRNSDELVVLTQYTGQYGATLCGIGFGNTDTILDNLYFDFEMALDYPFITFDYYHNNSWFGQLEAPGDNTPAIMQRAIEEARCSHIIQHPLDYGSYGYPAYDYDCWKMYPTDNDDKWQSAWYEGYWSFWLSSSAPSSEWIYSGTGFTGAQLQDGTIHGWTFTQFEEAMVGGMGEGNPPADGQERINYRPARNPENTLIESLREEYKSEPVFFTLSGLRLDRKEKHHGMVIIKQGTKTLKRLIK